MRGNITQFMFVNDLKMNIMQWTISIDLFVIYKINTNIVNNFKVPHNNARYLLSWGELSGKFGNFPRISDILESYQPS